MMTEAEMRLGGRLPGCYLGGILFAGDRPRIRSPFSFDDSVYIYLSMRVLFDLKEHLYAAAYWTMAHETVHLLSYIKGQKVTVLEEGIACWFQRNYSRSHNNTYWQQYIPAYANAEALFSRLLEYDTDIVKRLRQIEPAISLITSETLRLYCPELPAECAEALASPFDRNWVPSCPSKRTYWHRIFGRYKSHTSRT
jgi:hypothetical protein